MECFSWRVGRLAGIGSCPLHSATLAWWAAPDQKAIGAYQAFDEDSGNLKDESQQAAIIQLSGKLL